jgi:hypothetical protein
MATTSNTLTSSPRVFGRGFKRLTQLGWPRRFPIVQFPNAPMIAGLIAGKQRG